MTEYIGAIAVPEIAASGTFPIVPDYGYGYAIKPDVYIHQFGSGNAKIEQRFYQGTSAKRFSVRKAFISDADRVALRDFWETKYGPYGSFTYNAPNDSGTGTTAYTVRFADEPLSWESILDYVSSTGVNLVEVPTTSPSYSVTSTVERFPSSTLKTSLLDQAQEIIPLIKIQPREVGYAAIYVSDRRCTVGGQLYQARLLDVDGISQGIGNESDQANFVFGNADRVMRDLANDTDLTRASIEFALYDVDSQIKLNLWKGEVISWAFDSGPDFSVTASDGIYELTLPYPCRRVSRTCWKAYNDSNGCPYSTASTGLDTTHFPGVSAASCDRSYDGANGCLAHGMKHYFGGLIANPQTVGKFRGLGSDTIYESVMPEIYANYPSYRDDTGTWHYGLPVPCLFAIGADQSNRYQGVGIVGEGPITFGLDHTIDSMYPHGYPSPPAQDRRTISGSDPAGDHDYMSIDVSGDTTGGDFRKVYWGSRTYTDNFSAGTAAVILRRDDDKGLQLSKADDHSMQAIVTYGLSGWIWTAAGEREWLVLSNPVWVAVNMLLKALGLRYASAATAEQYFDVTAAVAAAAICNETVSKLIGAGVEFQFSFQGIVGEEKPLRDWLTDVLQNCIGYYTFAFGKLKIGCRINSSVVEAFTEGNVLFNSVQLSPNKPTFNYLSGYFADNDFRGVRNSVTVQDIDHAALIGGSTAPLYLKAQIELVGTGTKSQAARIITTRLREELGGINAAQWKDARNVSFKTTVLALNVEPGMVCSLTHNDMPGGTGEFRVTGWRLNKDYSIDVQGRTTVDEMYDMTVGPKPEDVDADPVPVETEIIESPFVGMYEGLNSDGTVKDDRVTSASIADGAVIDTSLSDDAVRARHILATARGGVLNYDPNSMDASAWEFTGSITLEDNAASPTAKAIVAVDDGLFRTAEYVQIDPSRNYELRMWAKQLAGTSPAYLMVQFFDATKTIIYGTDDPAGWIGGTYHYWGLINEQPPATWTEYRIAFGADETVGIPTGAKYIRLGALSNYLATGTQGFTGIRLFQRIDGNLLVDGAVEARTVQAKAIQVEHLYIIPDTLTRDPYFQDQTAWTQSAGDYWHFRTAAADSRIAAMGVLSGVIISDEWYATTGSPAIYTPTLPFASEGQTLGYHVRLNNTSNREARVLMFFWDKDGGLAGYTIGSLAAGSGVDTVEGMVAVPAGTAQVTFQIGMDSGAAFTGVIAASELKVWIGAGANLIVDGSVIAGKIATGAVEAENISVDSLSAIEATLGNVSAGTITGSTFRTTADGSGNYIELSGTSIYGKDSGDATIWEILPNAGPLAMTDWAASNLEKTVSSSYFDALSGYATYSAYTSNDGAGQAAGLAAAFAAYAAGTSPFNTMVGRWDITSLIPTNPRWVMVRLSASVTATNRCQVSIGPATFTAGTWVTDHWEYTLISSAAVINATLLAPASGSAITDSRIMIVPVHTLGSKKFLQLSYTTISGTTGKARIIGVIA